MALVMFDYDGVIVNSLELFIPDFIAACRENGFKDLVDQKDVLTMFEHNVYEAMRARGLNQETIDSILAAYENKAREHIEKVKMFEGMDKALEKIGLENSIYIITSNASNVTTLFLKRMGITCVKGVLGADVEKSKIKKIQNLVAKYPELPAYYVGDTIGDISEGKKAGVKTVGVNWGWHGGEKMKASGPDFLVSSPDELAALFSHQKRYKVTFQPQDLTVEVLPNTTVLAAALENNLPLEGPCNGRGVCGKCLVRYSGLLSSPGDREKGLLGEKLKEGHRLACQAKITGDAEIILGEKRFFHVVSGGKTKNYEFDPVLKNDLVDRDKSYGIAIDIGTTSLVVSLNDLKRSGKELGIEAGLNPQTQFGGDVITRITFAHKNEKNVRQLKAAVISGINQMIEALCQKHGVEPNSIYHITVAANTTMLHLLVGIDPISLAVAPYTPSFVNYREMPVSELGITASPEATVSLLPSLSAFVGADILAGMIATGFPSLDVPSLFIDVGTNGEIVANVNGKLVATSSAAGPALEGMNIQCGCRAEDGAISGVEISAEGDLHITTIGSAKPKGLCGSGLVELVMELVKAGVIETSGKFAQGEQLPLKLAERLIRFDEQSAFLIDSGAMLVLTQKDIRQVQLAKAALAAAIEILFQRLQLELSSVEKIYIAGAFGYHLKPEALRGIGLLPFGLNAGIEFVGNTAKEGARLCLLSKAALEEIQRLQETMNSLELSYAPEFQDNFVEQLDFPSQ